MATVSRYAKACGRRRLKKKVWGFVAGGEKRPGNERQATGVSFLAQSGPTLFGIALTSAKVNIDNPPPHPSYDDAYITFYIAE